MSYARYWTQRDSFLRRQSRLIEKDCLREKYHNAYFSVFRLRDGRYAVSNYAEDEKTGADVIAIAGEDVIRDLIRDPEGWGLFFLRAESDGRTVLLNHEGFKYLAGLDTVRNMEEAEETPFEYELAKATELYEFSLLQEQIVGTPEWRKNVEREVHELVLEDKKRTANYGFLRKLFLEPSVRRRLKNEGEAVTREQNRRMYEAMEAERRVSDGIISSKTVKAGIFALAGILLSYLLIALQLSELAFAPVLAGGTVAFILLKKDDNADTKNMNGRLIVWFLIILCLVVTAVDLIQTLG